MDGLGTRIRAAADIVGGLDRLAELIPTMSRRSLSDYVSSKSEPRAALIGEIASKTGVSAGWLLVGEGEMLTEMPRTGLRQFMQRVGDVADQRHYGSEGLNQPNFVRLPVYSEVQASAGSGALPASEQVNNVVAFDRSFLRGQGGNPDRCSIIFARGTSMKPTIPDGAILVVDHSQRDVAHGCIYVFNVCDQLLVKRARWRMDGKLELVSDNKNEDYPVETFGPEQVDDLRVVGRVVYFCRAP